MALDTWFPLAVHTEDLALTPATLDRLVEAILTLAGRSPDPGAAWTGDIDGVDTLHHDPDFDELTDAVASGVWTCLTELGHPTHELDLLVQRGWPVVVQQVVSDLPLREATSTGVRYLDVATESKGYIYVLLVKQDSGPPTFFLDTLGFDVVLGPDGRPEPGLSEWMPSTPAPPSS